jgi:hypothetical protein
LTLEQETLEQAFKMIIDECDRRSMNQKESPKVNNSEICKKYLYPDLEQDVVEIFEKQLEIKTKKREEKKQSKDDAELDFSICFCEGETCEAADQKQSKKKEKRKVALCPNISSFITDEILKRKKWVERLKDPESDLIKYVNSRIEVFFKFQFWFKYYAYGILGKDSVVTKALNDKRLPFSDQELIAICLQNKQYPKSSYKKEAIEAGTYIAINGEESAEEYLKNIFSESISKIAKSAAQKVHKIAIKNNLKKLTVQFNATENIEEAAQMLHGTKKGRGDIKVFTESLQNDFSNLTLEKIKLIDGQTYSGEVLYSDKNADNYSKQNGLSQKKIFNIWLHCVKKLKLVTEDEFFGHFSNYQEKKQWWNQYFSGEGEPVVKKDEATRIARRGKKAAWRKRKSVLKKPVVVT